MTIRIGRVDLINSFIRFFLAILIFLTAGILLNLDKLTLIQRSLTEIEEEWEELERLSRFQGSLNDLIAYISFHQVIRAPSREILLREIKKAKINLNQSFIAGHHQTVEGEAHAQRHMKKELATFTKLQKTYDGFSSDVEQYFTAAGAADPEAFLNKSLEKLIDLQAVTYELQQVYAHDMKQAVATASKARAEATRQTVIISVILIALVSLAWIIAVFYLNYRARKMLEQERLLTIGALTHSLVHEIRNPLNIIKTSASVIRKDLAQQQKNHELIDYMIDEVDRIDDLMNQLLSLEGKAKTENQKEDIAAIIRQVIALFDAKLKKSGVSLEWDDTAAGAKILCNKNQIKQVLINVLLNAIQASREGGHITIQTQTEPNKYAIAIRDSGKGMTEAELRRLFEPFYTTKETGLGLGLLIVKRIIEQHKGHINITSQKNEGTTVHITLPSHE